MSKCDKKSQEFLAKGENFLTNKKFSLALENFNNCLRFASSNSNESSRSFAARAKLFYNVKLFRECNENIQLAKIDNGLFDEDLRQFEEQELKSDGSANKWNFFKLSHDANHKINFIVDCLEVREDDVYGRFIATTKDLVPGDILIVEEPFYKVLSIEEVPRRCSICFNQNSFNLLPCAECSTAMFCSKKCMESPIHKYECGRVEENFEKALLKRMFYQAISICGSPNDLEELMNQQEFVVGKTIMDFDLNTSDENVNLKNRILATTALVERDPWSKEAYTKYERVIEELQTQTGVDKDFLKNYLVHCLKAMTVNFFHFFWKSDERRGFAMCSLAAYFAHSCDPNCDKIDVENKFVFVVRKPIKAGEQLTICYDRYNFLTHPLDDRQEYFERVYTFKCSCTACTNDYKSLDELPKYDEDFQEQQVNYLSFSSVRDQYLKNCDYIKNKIENYPSFEICSLMNQNNRLLHSMGNMLPFEDDLL